MKRPKQHQTDSEGKALLRQLFAKVGWGVNEVTEDYGRDFEVEVFRQGESTGIIFGVQLKSSAAPRYSVAGDFISQVLDRPHALYLTSELRHPVLVIAADVERQKLYWLAPQMDVRLLEQVNIEDQQAGTHTVRIPTANELSSTIQRLVEKVGRIELALAARRLSQVSPIDFMAASEGQTKPEVLSHNLREASYFIDLKRAQDLATDDDFDVARSIIKDALETTGSSIEVKFFALLVSEKVETLAAGRVAAPQDLLWQIALATSIEMQKLTRSGPPHLKFFSIIARHAAELYRLALEDWGLYLNWKAHENSADVWWRAQLMFQRAEVARQILRKHNHCTRLASYAQRSPYRSALPRALLKVTNGLSGVVIRLKAEGLGEAAAAYLASALDLCKLAAHIAIESGDDESLGAPLPKV